MVRLEHAEQSFCLLGAQSAFYHWRRGFARRLVFDGLLSDGSLGGLLVFFDAVFLAVNLGRFSRPAGSLFGFFWLLLGVLFSIALFGFLVLSGGVWFFRR